MNPGAPLYRIHNSAGRGPWIPGFSMRWSDPTPPPAGLIPAFEEWPWILGRPPKPWSGIACRDLTTLRRWFSFAEYGRLLGFGFRCVTFIPDQVLAESSVQTLFRRNRPLADLRSEVELYPGVCR